MAIVLRHEFWGDLNLCSLALVTHIWPEKKISFEAKTVLLY